MSLLLKYWAEIFKEEIIKGTHKKIRECLIIVAVQITLFL